MPRSTRNSALYGAIALTVVIADVITKLWATYVLVPMHVPHPVIGEYVRFTLVYNPGAAFGLHLGEYSRWIFTALTLVALVVLWRLFTASRDGDFSRIAAIALVTGGAIGNLIDRIRSSAGVVDFIDIGVGDVRWPTFNVADMAVSVGAFLLAWVLWGEESDESRSVPARPISSEATES
jgi:signal peptidase II